MAEVNKGMKNYENQEMVFSCNLEELLQVPSQAASTEYHRPSVSPTVCTLHRKWIQGLPGGKVDTDGKMDTGGKIDTGGKMYTGGKMDTRAPRW